MRKASVFLVLSFIISFLSLAQKNSVSTGNAADLSTLSERDQQFLRNIPGIKVPPKYKSPAAPMLLYKVDNSTQPYLRPVFSQVALECGQASGIGYNFTYEMCSRRNVPANLPENQYPTHYAWNFGNNGVSCGVGFSETWEIIRGGGTVNVQDYGGMSTYGPNIWLSGYDYYYHAMKNRIDEIYSIPVGTPEGLQVLKHWINDHLEGAPSGGVAQFAAYATSAVTLPPGTEEGGQCVTIDWTPNTNHQLTIVGFNDSIRYDFNGDGQFTNNIDINGDGVVNVQDWEIGGVKWVNSFGTGVGNNGFCYTMYKNLADPKPQGGIWNNTVYVVIPKPDYQPKITFKVTLKHSNRSKVKVMAGISSDTASVVPEYVMEFPLFNYQGGAYYMQGGTTVESNKNLEFGLDVTPLLSYIPPNHPARYFLMVDEKDYDHDADGSIQAFSLIDYTPAPEEVAFTGPATPLTDNDLTMIWVNKTVNFPTVTLIDSVLPPATLYEPYNHQLTSTGGTPPYDYEMEMDYYESNFPQPFPTVTAEQLVLSNSSSGQVSKTLDFDFPFYGKKYHRVVVHVDGYLMFDDQPMPWPFIIDETIYQHNTKNISPLMTKTQAIPSGGGIWYEGDQYSATFRWKTVISGESNTDLNYAVKLYYDGNIEFYYGNIVIPYWLNWVGGISNGDLFNYAVMSGSCNPLPVADQVTAFIPAPFPVGLELSKTGLLYGTPLETTYGPVKIMVRDSRDIRNTKTLVFYTTGLEIEPVITSGTDNLIQYGESAYIGLKVKNISDQPMLNPVFHLTLSDPYFSLIDSVETCGLLNPGDTAFLPDAFRFDVSLSVPDNHPFTIGVFVPLSNDTLGREFPLSAYAPNLGLHSVQVMDGGNGYLDPGETSNVMISLKNAGGAAVENITVTLSTSDPYLTFNTATGIIPSLIPGGSGNVLANVTVAAIAPLDHLALVNLSAVGNNQVSMNVTFYLKIGYNGENFETADFSMFDWHFGGDAPWFITDSLPYQGQNCARSGDVSDNEESILYISLNVQAPGNIGFYRRVSCEQDVNNHNYDYLGFYIDNVEKQRWDGYQDWQYFAYPVETGYHTFKWNFHKDYSVSWGKDAAWIDEILFPTFGDIVSVDHPESQDITKGCRVIPNPFTSGASFLFRVNDRHPVSLVVYDIQGKIIKTLLKNQQLEKGDQLIRWNLSEGESDGLAPGVYFYTLITSGGTTTGKLIKY
ncbi:MAG: T9SS type A sorting domain-containing protein [Bacteroidetes bacterium]|nr:T9SS type A sorting domain-containing protein [Bacteroidota bacterium]